MEDIYEEGQDAYEQGKLLIENPFGWKHESAHHIAWQTGWLTAAHYDLMESVIMLTGLIEILGKTVGINEE